jgi:hypothetical protein
MGQDWEENSQEMIFLIMGKTVFFSFHYFVLYMLNFQESYGERINEEKNRELYYHSYQGLVEEFRKLVCFLFHYYLYSNCRTFIFFFF